MSEKAPLGRMLTVGQAAERLGMDTAKLRREIRARRIRVLKPAMGKNFGIYETWCDEYVAAHTIEPTGNSRGRVDPFEAPPAPDRGIKAYLPPKRQLHVS